MIAMLEILPDERRQILKKLDRFAPRKISAQLILAGDIPIVSVRHREHIRGISWKGLEAVTEARDWLLPRGINKPDGCSIKPFVPSVLPSIMMDNMAANVICNADIKPSALSVGIYPEEESCITDTVVSRAREVRILCEKDNEELAQSIMDKYGAAVICSDSEDIFEGCQMIIASKDKAGRARASKNALLFSPCENQPSALHVRSTLPSVPEVYSYPARLFGALKTLSAFYELENKTELGLITPSMGYLSDGLVTSRELSRYLKSLTV